MRGMAGSAASKSGNGESDEGIGCENGEAVVPVGAFCGKLAPASDVVFAETGAAASEGSNAEGALPESRCISASLGSLSALGGANDEGVAPNCGAMLGNVTAD